MPSHPSLRTVSNPPNPWHDARVEWVGEPPAVALELYEERARSIVTRNESPDVMVTWTVNPYRGCYHGCAYCYARPSHEYLDFGAGTDFERKLTYKPKAAELLRAAFERRSWRGEVVAFSGITDCYQPLEASLELTRGCLEVCLEYRNPVQVITKSVLIERDVELLVALAREAHCTVTLSIPFFDADRAKALEPYVPSPRRRLEAVRRLAEAGLVVGVNVAPIIPGLTDSEVPAILEAARGAGATFAGFQMLRLPGPVREVFVERLRAALPLRAARVLSQIADCRDGKLNDSRFGARMTGTGERWAAIEALFRSTARRLGFGQSPEPPVPSSFRRPDRSGQLGLL
jgi:DNA repair photolyase